MFNTQELKNAVSQLYKVAQEKTPVPVLKMLKFDDYEDGHMFISATNYEMGLSLKIACEKPLNGFCIPAKQLNDLLNTANSGSDIQIIEKDGKSAIVKIERSRNKLSTLSVEEFPITEENTGELITIDAQILYSALIKAIVNVSKSSSHGVICGVNIKSEGNIFSVTSTDGFRASITKLMLGMPDFTINLPLQSSIMLASLLKDRTTVQMSVEKYRVLVLDEQMLFTSRLIEGEYPHVERIIPTHWATEIEIDTNEFLMKLKRALIFASNINGAITIDVGDDYFDIEGDGGTSGKSNSKLDNYEKNGENIKVSVNGIYLQNILKFADDKFVLRTNAALTPIGIHFPGQDTFEHIIMTVHMKKRK